MRTTSKLFLALMIFTMLSSSPVFANVNERSVTHVVIIDGMKFTPETLTAKVGDIIIWTNKDIVPHTATGSKKEFDSGEIKVTSSWKFKVKKKGHTTYGCSFHPTMKASLEVNQ
ncbi:MAG: copper-binding protein [Bdellovibrionaceae bacterium]|nr:copper-binding protein [Bdellovibrio sp.]